MFQKNIIMNKRNDGMELSVEDINSSLKIGVKT